MLYSYNNRSLPTYISIILKLLSTFNDLKHYVPGFKVSNMLMTRSMEVYIWEQTWIIETGILMFLDGLGNIMGFI